MAKKKEKAVIELSGYPQKKQLEFFKADTKYIAYGGARGGGKSWALRRKMVLLALNYDGINILIIRRTLPELRDNHVRPLQKELKDMCTYSELHKCFSFPNGSKINLGYLDCDNDLLRYQGQEYDIIAIDEATQISEYKFSTLKACLRGANTFPKRMYLTCNPGGIGHGWVKRLFIDRQYRDGEKSNEYTFIPALVYDNEILLKHNPDYLDQLKSLSPNLKRAWLEGKWDAGGGTRLIFTGDKEKKGSYYKSALQNPLYFPADGEEIVGDGCENVTALMKMYGALIILCENSIYRMDYNLTESGVYFTCKQISCETGCDMPNSVQLIDNRVVFANSKKGIFIIDSMDEAGEHNIKPIGLNVLSGRDMGFLDTEASDKHKACSIDFDRKYCLFIKDRAYIWDYNKVQYSDKYDYSKAAERLVWYVYDGLTQGDAFNLGKNLYFLSKDDNCIYGFFESDSVDFDIKLFSGYMDFGVSTSYKLVDKISLFMSNPNGEQSAIAFYCDGEKYYTAPLASACQKLCKVDVLLPKKRLYRFGFEIRTKSKITIENIEISYKILSK